MNGAPMHFLNVSSKQVDSPIDDGTKSTGKLRNTATLAMY